jgi:hypothetical protein
MQRLPSYEIIRTHSSYSVVRNYRGVSDVIERFENEAAALDFFCFLRWVAKAPRRLASH